jgi:hypothetical protein
MLWLRRATMCCIVPGTVLEDVATSFSFAVVSWRPCFMIDTVCHFFLESTLLVDIVNVQYSIVGFRMSSADDVTLSHCLLLWLWFVVIGDDLVKKGDLEELRG